MSFQLDMTTKLFVQTCINCGIAFGMPNDYDTRLRETHNAFYCPNGHSQFYSKETEAERLKRQLDETNRLLVVKNNMISDRNREIETLERSNRSIKAHSKRLKIRAAAGVCPAGCKRHFTNIQRHMASKHPHWSEGD